VRRIRLRTIGECVQCCRTSSVERSPYRPDVITASSVATFAATCHWSLGLQQSKYWRINNNNNNNNNMWYWCSCMSSRYPLHVRHYQVISFNRYTGWLRKKWRLCVLACSCCVQWIGGPSVVSSVTVEPSHQSKSHYVVSWQTPYDGGMPIRKYVLRYRRVQYFDKCCYSIRLVVVVVVLLWVKAEPLCPHQ